MEELQLDTVYRPGKRTFFYLWGNYAWWLTGLCILFGYITYELYFGSWKAPVTKFLTDGQWYLDAATFAQWAALTSLSFLIIAFLRVSVMYRQYSFYLDDYAFHLRRGIFRIQEITIPYSQISNVHIEQPYLWRLQGLAELDITVSNGPEFSHIKKRSEFLVPCIDKPRAKALSHFLIEMASQDDDDEEDELDDVEDAEDIEIVDADSSVTEEEIFTRVSAR